MKHHDDWGSVMRNARSISFLIALLFGISYAAIAAGETDPADFNASPAITGFAENRYDPTGALWYKGSPNRVPDTALERELGFSPNVQVNDDVYDLHRQSAITLGPGGALYVCYCEQATHYNPERAMFTRSDDDGETWLDPAVLINDTSPNSVGAPAIDILPDGSIGVVWSEMQFGPDFNHELRFSLSTDGGFTWSPSVVLHPPNPEADMVRPSMVVVGTRVIVSYWHLVTYPAAMPVVVYSDDRGEHWSNPVLVSTDFGTYTGAAPCMAYEVVRGELGLVMESLDVAIYFYKSTTLGETWSDAVQVNDVTPTSVRYPDLATHGGNYYVVWSDNRAATTDTNIWLSQSADGLTWSPSIMVNEDIIGNQYAPHISADPAGNLHVCWLWCMPFEADVDLYYSFSDNGGTSFLAQSPRVNDVPHVVTPGGTWTSDLISDANGAAYFTWNDGRETNYYDDIYFCHTDNSSAIGESAPVRGVTGVLLGRGLLHVVGHPGTHPRIQLVLSEAVPNLKIDLVDLAGRTVGTLREGGMPAGTHEFDPMGGAARAAGVYFIRLTDGRDTAGHKVVLWR